MILYDVSAAMPQILPAVIFQAWIKKEIYRRDAEIAEYINNC